MEAAVKKLHYLEATVLLFVNSQSPTKRCLHGTVQLKATVVRAIKPAIFSTQLESAAGVHRQY